MISTADPLAESDTAIAEVTEPTPTKRRGLLLIVDDEDGPRQSLRVIFKDDYDLLMAEDGPTAIELAQKHPGGRGGDGHPHGRHVGHRSPGTP